MGTALRSSLHAGLRGKIGDLVYKWYGKRLVVTMAPRPSKKKPTPKQTAGRRDFARASQYAEKARLEPDLWAIYEAVAKKRRIPTRSLAISDFRTRPKVRGVSVNFRQGDPAKSLTIDLDDRFRFKTVAIDVVIRDATGKELERGQAMKGSLIWSYTVRKAKLPLHGPYDVEVTAFDRFKRRTRVRCRGTPNRFGEVRAAP